MGHIGQDKPAVSCVGCFAWGQLPGRFCRACYTYGQLNALGVCLICRRDIPVHDGHCRLCRAQASWAVKAAGATGEAAALAIFLRGVKHQQLFFANLQRPRNGGPPVGKQGRRVRKRAADVEPVRLHSPWVQPRLTEAPQNFSRFARHRRDLANPTLDQARRRAGAIGEAHGWTRWVAREVDRALVILLSGHQTGDKISYSQMSDGLRHFGLTIKRTAEILDQLDLLEDDRVPVFESWLSQRLDGLADGIRRDVEDWLRTLRDGGPRSQPRQQGTAMKYLTEIRPVLLDWSERLDHLREVTRTDILAVRDQLEGSKRHHTLSVLRSLFRHCKKQGTIFRDPTARIRVGRQDYRVLLPLEPHEVRAAVDAATTPAARLALALAAVHAARPKAVRELQLDDVDLGNRRLVLAGRARPLDDLTRPAVLAWLDYRRQRWPNTANPHLIVSQHTAMDTRPVSGVWITEALRGQTATLERLRMDRQLEEALTHGPDPLHLAEVFGLDEKTAIRYANSARQILERPLESDPATSPRTQGSTPRQHDDGPAGSH
ncbi:hypothetical protein [Streptomyces sp. NPDC060010]|uniref:hypothetical protein n=1 Tax=Streptomyces sp. NPDC060010 TaxID=3347036 RepID=UPI00369D246C